jgi:hypothetical protein
MRYFSIRRLLLVITVSALLVTDTIAQKAPPLQSGDFVRITRHSAAEPVTGTILQALPDTLIVRQANLPRTGSAYRIGDHDLAVPISAIIDVERRLSRKNGAVRGAAVGAAIGLFAGGIVGYMSYEPCEPGLFAAGLCTRQVSIAGGAILGTVPGLVLGAAIGSSTVIETWERVELQPRLSLEAQGGGLTLVIRL